MRYLLFFLVMAAYSVHALSPGVKGVEKGKCTPSHVFEYIVVGSAGDGVYTLKGNFMSPNALVRLKHGKLRQGELVMHLKYVGTKDMEMESGFNKPVDFWDECDGK